MIYPPGVAAPSGFFPFTAIVADNGAALDLPGGLIARSWSERMLAIQFSM
jgi:hypothetical protein